MAIKEFFQELKFKCYICGKEVINNRYKKRIEGLASESICLECLKKELYKLK